MGYTPNVGYLVGQWTYRSFFNNPDISVQFNDLKLGLGTMAIEPAPMGVFKGVLSGGGASLALNGSVNYGFPAIVRFQLTGKVGGEDWKYDYLGFVVPPWPNGINQLPSIVGTLVQSIPLGDGKGGVSPAGLVGSWVCVWQGELPSK